MLSVIPKGVTGHAGGSQYGAHLPHQDCELNFNINDPAYQKADLGPVNILLNLATWVTF